MNYRAFYEDRTGSWFREFDVPDYRLHVFVARMNTDPRVVSFHRIPAAVVGAGPGSTPPVLPARPTF